VKPNTTIAAEEISGDIEKNAAKTNQKNMWRKCHQPYQRYCWTLASQMLSK